MRSHTTDPTHGLAGAVLVVLASTWSATAWTAPRRVLVIVSGAGADAVAVQNVIAETLASNEPPGIPLITAPADECLDVACARQKAIDQDADGAVHLVVTAVGGSRLLLLRIVDLRPSESLAERSGTVPDAPGGLADAVRSLLPRSEGPLAPAPAPSPTTASAPEPPPPASTAPPPPPPAPPPDEATPWYKQWWFWGVIAVGAAVTVFLVIKNTGGDDNRPTTVDVLAPDPTSLLPRPPAASPP